MQIPDGICRGSLIIDKGRKYVVIRYTNTILYLAEYVSSEILLVANDFRTTSSEVDVCFPGPVIDVPYYIR